MNHITVVGTGWLRGQLTLDAVEALSGARRVILHTERCECADWLRERGIDYRSLDALYEASEDFDEHARRAAEAVLAEAEDGDVVYGVFDVRDRSVDALMALAADAKAGLRVIAGPPEEGPLWAMGAMNVVCLEAGAWERYTLTSATGALIREIDTRQLASEVKLKLMDVYPEDSRVHVLFGNGTVAHVRLYELDRLACYDHRTSALVGACESLTALERFTFDRFKEIIDRLIAPDGCPWDRVQTHETLRSYLVEEAWEAVGAIDEGEPWHVCDELGDVLLQVVLHAAIAEKHGEFSISDVIDAIARKMISRHSHVFGGDEVSTAQEVGAIWSRNKMHERGQTTYAETLRDVSRSYPAVMRAGKVLKRADAALRGKPDPRAALRALRETVDAPEDGADSEARVGAIALKWIDYARSLGVDPEIAVGASTEKVIERFARMESEVIGQGRSLDGLSPEEAGKYWDWVKSCQ